MKEVKAGTVLIEEGQTFEERYLIMKGMVQAVNGGVKLLLRAGDVIGLCEANKDTADFTYQVTEDVSLFTFPGEKNGLYMVMEKNSEMVHYFKNSLFRQLNEIGGRGSFLQNTMDHLWQYLKDCHGRYVMLCKEEGCMSEVLPGYEELQKPESRNCPPEWMGGYYATMEQMLSVWDHNNTDSDFFHGFMVKTSADMENLITYCREMQAYREEICYYLMNKDDVDLFDLYTNLYMSKLEEGSAKPEKMLALKMKIREMVSFVKKQCETETDYYQNRLEEFEKNITELGKQINDKVTEDDVNQDVLEEISGSMDKILKYAGCDEQLEANFKKYLLAYKRLPNKNGNEDVTRALRHELTSLFYKVYAAAFQASIREKKMPVLIKMFLNFGYVDEELAGIGNAVYLYQLAEAMPTAPEQGIYSVYEWLMAIYSGKKEPGRNEFDMDYAEYLRDKKKAGKITDEQEKSLINNRTEKVMYELENVLPSVNKISFGRPSTFCPVFSKHNILKPLSSILVTSEKITDIITQIRAADFGLFYRETLFSEPDKGIPKEVIQVEVLPDVILAPNVGTRGIMWQEIEGKKRNTPARMFCSVFQLEDLPLTMIHLAAEFRWEMCKRIQGVRWNDISERSLTSEYCDYAQFYKKNKDLSADTKERIKVQLGKARNNFKEMFIMDYISWIRYESIGSPRLNKAVRNILFTYCPFPKEVADKLAANPMYKEIVDKYNIRTAQKIHHVDNVCKRLINMGKPIPEEFAKYREFLET